jgi:hypothetical protein
LPRGAIAPDAPETLAGPLAGECGWVVS